MDPSSFKGVKSFLESAVALPPVAFSEKGFVVYKTSAGLKKDGVSCAFKGVRDVLKRSYPLSNPTHSIASPLRKVNPPESGGNGAHVVSGRFLVGLGGVPSRPTRGHPDYTQQGSGARYPRDSRVVGHPAAHGKSAIFAWNGIIFLQSIQFDRERELVSVDKVVVDGMESEHRMARMERANSRDPHVRREDGAVLAWDTGNIKGCVVT
jgi:hypothetical protein